MTTESARFQSMRIQGPDRSLLVVIDVQTRMVEALDRKVVDRNLAAMRLLLHAARELNVPVLVTEHYPRGLGPTLDAIEELLHDAHRLEKIVFSCLGAPGFLETVKSSGRTQVVLIGTETHVCVAQTALDLLAEGFHVHVPSDGVISRFTDDFKGGLSLMQQAGAVITRSETLVFQWLQRAGTPAFKALSPLIKNRTP